MPLRRIMVGLTAIAAMPVAGAFVLFDAGGFLGYTWLKWGPVTPGTAAIIEWSYLPPGTPGSPSYCGDACPGTSSTTLNFYDHESGTWETRDLVELESSIRAALRTWAAAADIVFVGPVADDGRPVDDDGAVPPATGHIRIGAFAFAGDADGVAAVGYAPPPNGGPGEGDIFFNANAFFQEAPGQEDVTLIDFYFGNDFPGLFLHELGHAIGLAHSTDADAAVMNISPPTGFLINRELDADDIAGAQTLYGVAPDGDTDGVADSLDNCPALANADQRDTDADGFGNRCDPDFDNDCLVGFPDLNRMKLSFFTTDDPDTDLDGDGETGFTDLNTLKLFFFSAPGPGAVEAGCS